MEIGMLEAKTHLSGLVDRALSGEDVVVTRHGKRLVRLVPVEGDADARPEVKAVDDLLRFMDERRSQPVDVLELIRQAREERLRKLVP